MPGVRAYILFPKDQITQRQQIQITCWGDNIQAIAVNGTFDQCQQMVKRTLANHAGSERLTTANSINIARLLPQILFYSYVSMQVIKHHNKAVNFIVPSGNLGNVTACYWAKQMGFPIDEIRIANNANQVLKDFLASGIYEPQPSIQTIANAMDVGDPSNLERLLALFPNFTDFKQQMNVASVSNEAIREAIVDCYQRHHYLICPHTATAYQRLREATQDKPWVIMATAHPVKFNEIIEPLLDINISIPEQLNRLLAKNQQFKLIEPKDESLLAQIHR
jgi:threonine synthase